MSRDGQSLRLEWTQDNAFRFFPVEADPEFGWRLHLADLATNKVLALAGRWEVRDFVDTLYLDGHYASLGLLAWAAAGKDPGMTPLLILEQAHRFNRLRPEDFQVVAGIAPFDFVAMKTRWREMIERARANWYWPCRRKKWVQCTWMNTASLATHVRDRGCGSITLRWVVPCRGLRVTLEACRRFWNVSRMMS